VAVTFVTGSLVEEGVATPAGTPPSTSYVTVTFAGSPSGSERLYETATDPATDRAGAATLTCGGALLSRSNVAVAVVPSANASRGRMRKRLGRRWRARAARALELQT
jgi:hypothetical protein